MKVINLKILIVLLLAIAPHISAKECVVLLHGMARGNGSMAEIETVLSDSGYTVVNHDYPSTKATIQILAAKELPKAIGNCPTGVTINFVTHSLGGIILRQYLSTDTLKNIGRVVMLGPPNKGSEVVDNLGDWKVFEFVNGPAGTQLGTEKSSVPNTIGPAYFEEWGV